MSLMQYHLYMLDSKRQKSVNCLPFWSLDPVGNIQGKVDPTSLAAMLALVDTYKLLRTAHNYSGALLLTFNEIWCVSETES